VENAIKSAFGVDRKAVIRENRCVPKPLGCGEPITEFRDALSEKEYSISGFCQKCQDAFFGS